MGRFRVRRGLKLPISQTIPKDERRTPVAQSVAVMAADYNGLRPRMRVQVGDTVKRGSLLFEDGSTPGVRYTSPGAGTILAINRGERRALQSVVIALDDTEKQDGKDADEVTYAAYKQHPIRDLKTDGIRDLLVESGLWTALRARPFEKVPPPETLPHGMFVIAMDTDPLSPDPDPIVDNNKDLWLAGLEVLSRLVPKGKVHVCSSPESELPLPDVKGIEHHTFQGPPSVGTPGLIMHLVDPVDRDKTAWHVGYQDVLAIGHLFLFGKLRVSRTISLAGPLVDHPCLIETRLGASVDSMVKDALREGAHRVISGTVLSGRTASGDIHGYLGRYHNQMTVLAEATDRKLLGWLGPGFDRFSVLRLFASKLLFWRKPRMNTDFNGSERVMVPIGVYEKVWPFNLLATPLLRALLSKDDETAEALGCLELAEEDLAVCSFVCPSKIDYGQALRNTLNRIEEEG